MRLDKLHIYFQIIIVQINRNISLTFLFVVKGGVLFSASSRGPTQKHSAGILINKLRNFKTIKSKLTADDNDNENIQSLNGKIQH